MKTFTMVLMVIMLLGMTSVTIAQQKTPMTKPQSLVELL